MKGSGHRTLARIAAVLVSTLIFTGATTVFASPAMANDASACSGPAYDSSMQFNKYLTYAGTSYARFAGSIWQNYYASTSTKIMVYSIGIDDLVAEGDSPYFYLRVIREDGTVWTTPTYYHRLSASGGWGCVYSSYSSSNSAKWADKVDLVMSTTNSPIPLISAWSPPTYLDL